MSPTPEPFDAFRAFRTGDLVAVFTDSVRALARVRESSEGGRLHIAFEMGEYLPWVDTAVVIRHVQTASTADVALSPAAPAARSYTARILHAGTSTALLQLLHAVEEAAEELPRTREPYDTIPSLDEQ